MNSQKNLILERLNNLSNLSIEEKLDLYLNILIYEFENKDLVKSKHKCSYLCFASMDLTDEEIKGSKELFDEYNSSTEEEKEKIHKNCNGIILNYENPQYKFYGSILDFLQHFFSDNVRVDFWNLEMFKTPKEGHGFGEPMDFYEWDMKNYNWYYTKKLHKENFYNIYNQEFVEKIKNELIIEEEKKKKGRKKKINVVKSEETVLDMLNYTLEKYKLIDEIYKA